MGINARQVTAFGGDGIYATHHISHLLSVGNISERPSSRSYNLVYVSSTQFEIETEESNQKESMAFIPEVVKMKNDNQATLTKNLR